MSFLLYTTKSGRTASIQLRQPRVWGSLAMFVATILLIAARFGYTLGDQNAMASVKTADPEANESMLQSAIKEQRIELQQVRKQLDMDINALAVRVGKMQAQVLRMEALGKQLVHTAKLDGGEFDFDHWPALGGPADPGGVDTSSNPNFLSALDDLQEQIDDRARQLELIEQLSITRNQRAAVSPSGRPIIKGWTSSYFGMRTDPFHGRQAMHKGMDFAGKRGSDVVATAGGVVTWAGKRYGYGQLIEVNHGTGYSTRYGHAGKILVKVGDIVQPGQKIALMGSSGRSTGPHVHYEVLKNGKQIDPTKFIRANR